MRAALLVGAVAVAGVAALSAAAPAPAATKPACWKQLLTDWYDGRIDKTYPIPCYRNALKHLPTDVDVYSSARQDIQRALATAVANHETKVPAGAGSPPKTATGMTSRAPTRTTPTTQTAARPAPAAQRGRSNDNGPVGDALGSASDSADSIPVPLLILGGLALLLVAAGVAGMVVRRVQSRRLEP